MLIGPFDLPIDRLMKIIIDWLMPRRGDALEQRLVAHVVALRVVLAHLGALVCRCHALSLARRPHLALRLVRAVDGHGPGHARRRA